MGMSSGPQGQLFEGSIKQTEIAYPQHAKLDNNQLIQSYPSLNKICTVIKSAIDSNAGNPVVLQIKAPLSKTPGEFYIAKEDLVGFFNLLKNTLAHAEELLQITPECEIRLPFFKVLADKSSVQKDVLSSQISISKNKQAIIIVESKLGAFKFDPQLCNLSKSPWNQLYDKTKLAHGSGIPQSIAKTKTQDQNSTHTQTLTKQQAEKTGPTLEGINSEDIEFLAKELL